MTFQVGDKIKWKLPRKGTVTSVNANFFTVRLGDVEWSFENSESVDFDLIASAEPVEGSVVVDCSGDVFVRGELGWYMGAAELNSAAFAWRWKDLNDAYGPLTVVYHYVDTIEA